MRYIAAESDPATRTFRVELEVQNTDGALVSGITTEIEIPTLVVWGLNDHIVPVEAAIGYHRLIPNSRVELFERTGHVPQMERPARFNQLVDSFVAESPRSLGHGAERG